MRPVLLRLGIAFFVIAASSLLPVLPLAAQGGALATIHFSSFGSSRVVTQAGDLGFIAREGLSVESSSVTSSEQQAQDVIDGRWDIVSTNADNIVYWDEDLGADAFIFMVREGPITQNLYVAPNIQAIEDLRGTTLVVDSANSGYVTVLRRILLDHGLVAYRDYSFLSIGNTALRTAALIDGRAQGGMLGTLADDAAAAGVHQLARGADFVPAYAANPLATSRRFAADHPEQLLAFTRAIINTQSYLADPANADSVIASIARTDNLDATRATNAYRQIGDLGGTSVDEQVQLPAMQYVLDLRAAVGAIASPPPPVEKYVNPAWYGLALSSM